MLSNAITLSQPSLFAKAAEIKLVSSLFVKLIKISALEISASFKISLSIPDPRITKLLSNLSDNSSAVFASTSIIRREILSVLFSINFPTSLPIEPPPTKTILLACSF